jgi:hypothetical protein
MGTELKNAFYYINTPDHNITTVNEQNKANITNLPNIDHVLVSNLLKRNLPRHNADPALAEAILEKIKALSK